MKTHKISTREIVILSVLWCIAIFLVIWFFPYQSTEPQVPVNSTPTPTIIINYSNFAKEESSNYIIRALPADARILLKFYNVSGADKVWEKSYAVTKSSVKEGTIENPDITLTLRSTYLVGLTNKNFCEVISKANNNGELGIEFERSALSLGWQYRGVVKYRSCFGM